MRQYTTDSHPIMVRTPRPLLGEIDRIARERGVSRAAVLLDAFRKQQGISANIFDEREARKPAAE
jgi:hypothetical protein